MNTRRGGATLAAVYLLTMSWVTLLDAAASAPRQEPETPTVETVATTTPIGATMTTTATPKVRETEAPSATVSATSTITPTLGPEWGVDALCLCHVPPFLPGSPECERLKAEYVRDVLRAWATQTALAAPPTPTTTETATPSATATETPSPTATATPEPTWTPRPTPTTEETPTARSARAHRVYLPELILRRRR